MDQQTRQHLENWIDRQFGPDQPELILSMVEQYEADPEFYDNVSWWRCHDDMVRAGRSTL